MAIERRIAVLVVAFGSVAAAISNSFSKSTSVDPVGPAKYPFIISLIIILLGALMFISTIKKKDDTENAKDKTKEKPGDILKLAITILVGIMYIYLFDKLGFIITNTIFIFTMLFIFEERNIKNMVFYSILTTLILYGIFKIGLDVLLPPIPFL
jgi:putative tricarboxylic transport membrane protein